MLNLTPIMCQIFHYADLIQSKLIIEKFMLGKALIAIISAG